MGRCYRLVVAVPSRGPATRTSPRRIPACRSIHLVADRPARDDGPAHRPATLRGARQVHGDADATGTKRAAGRQHHAAVDATAAADRHAGTETEFEAVARAHAE